jgi:hypothetical protein
MHYGNIMGQKANVPHLSYQAATFDIIIKELLMKGDDILSSIEVCVIETNKITVFCKWGSEGFATTLVPTVHQLLI